ncbi:ATP-binding protein [Candidatus Phytoplasma solani]|uniref:ATP-binding protein n=1 Tax=Candidatus Phytoplasma solani TaxID=69896 RepID=UPI00358F9285
MEKNNKSDSSLPKKNWTFLIAIVCLSILTIVSFIFGTVAFISNLKQPPNDALQQPPFPDSDEGLTPPPPQNTSGIKGDALKGLLEAFAPPETNYENFPGFDAVHGLKEPIEQLKEIAHRFDPTNAKHYQKIAPIKPMEYPKGAVLYGPPGTGKTLLAECFAKEAKMNFYIITPKNTLEEIEAIFRKARRNSPSLIFADEAEEIIKSRTSKLLEEGDTKKTDLLLAEIDGVKTDKENPVFFLAATNHKDKIDSAILSRLESIYIGYFGPEERKAFIDLMIKVKKFRIEEYAKNYYLDIIMQKFNKALEHPEMFAIALKHGFTIPALGGQEIKGNKTDKHPHGNLAPLGDSIKRQELMAIYARTENKNIAEIETKLASDFNWDSLNEADMKQKLELEKALQEAYEQFNHDKQLPYDIEDLEKVKAHFYDLLSGRKLEAFIVKAAMKAGKNKHEAITIADLEEAFRDYFGYQKEFAEINRNYELKSFETKKNAGWKVIDFLKAGVKKQNINIQKLFTPAEIEAGQEAFLQEIKNKPNR